MPKKYVLKSVNLREYVYEVVFRDDKSVLTEFVGVLPGCKIDINYIGNRAIHSTNTFEKIFEEYTPPPVKVVKYANVYGGTKKYIGDNLFNSVEERDAFNKTCAVHGSIPIATITWEEPASE